METGTSILTLIQGKTGNTREKILEDLSLTSIPSFILQFLPVYAHGTAKNSGDPVTIEYMVSPDYLALGTNEDFLRIPLMPKTAQRIAARLGCLLPTKRMVDQIYEAAPVKLKPRPYSPKEGEPGREDSRSYGKSNQWIQAQLVGRNLDGLLIAGHKKDIVITNQLLKKKGKVAIYGWHEKLSDPIQPLYLGHGDFYVDYSHGIRLVSKECKVNGVTMDLENVLQDPNYGHILTGAEPLEITRYP